MSRFLVMADWRNNAPHLTAKAIADLESSIPAYQRDARTKGIPQLGAGVIFPILEDELVIDPFPIPDHWPRGYGLDVGWNRTAALWRCYDPDAKPRVHYLYDEHYRGEADPTVHGAAIRKRGLWIPGRIDPASRGRNQTDGLKLLSIYRKAIYGEEDLSVGMRLLGIARNAVESGIYDQWMLMNQGLFKVFRHRCPNWLAERRLYRRDEKGQVIKSFDHAMDAGRYNVASGDGWLQAAPLPILKDPIDAFASGGRREGLSWMAGM